MSMVDADHSGHWCHEQREMRETTMICWCSALNTDDDEHLQSNSLLKSRCNRCDLTLHLSFGLITIFGMVSFVLFTNPFRFFDEGLSLFDRQ